MSYRASVVSTKEHPNKQALDDARKYCELEPTSFEAPMCAAAIYGEAARKDDRYKPSAIEYLEQALVKGMPIEWVGSFMLEALLPDVNKEVRAKARSKDANERFESRRPNDPPATADWDAFEKEFGVPARPVQNRKLLARP